VTILAHPPASHIYVDGRFKGFGRTRDVALAPGGHEIRLEHPGCAACAVTRYTLTVDPARPPGQAFRYRIRYRPARLLVRTDSAGKVFLDDRYIGASNTPLAVEMEGPRPRRAKLRVTAGGAVLGPRNVDLVPGKTTTVQLGVGR